jgi:hypothetical protein
MTLCRFCVRCSTEVPRSCERSPGSSTTRSTTCETRVRLHSSPTSPGWTYSLELTRFLPLPPTSERGVVWEETIILLPHKVHYVFLSATIPNSLEFAEWVAKTHDQPCHVVYTDFRPTPLQHYLFPAGGDGIFLVVDEKSQFREDNFQKAMGGLAALEGEDPANPNGGKGRKGKTKKGAMKGGK